MGSSNSPSSGDEGGVNLLGLPISEELQVLLFKFFNGGRLSGEPDGDLEAGLFPLLVVAELAGDIGIRRLTS